MNEQTQNLSQAFLVAMDTYPERFCLQIKWGGRYQQISYHRFQSRVFRLIKFFQEQDLTTGDRIVIAADNCLEWLVAYVSCLMTGGVVVPVQVTAPPDVLRFILKDTGAHSLILQNQEYLQTIPEILSPDAFPNLKSVLVINDPDITSPKITAMETIFAEFTLTPENEAAIRSLAAGIPPQSLASIYYIGDQSEQLKGACFTQVQLLAALRHVAGWFTFDEDDMAFTSRPWSEHSSLLTSIHYLLSGITNALRSSFDTVLEDMRHTSPTVAINIPYGLELFYEKCMTKIAEQSDDSQKVFQWALAKGKEFRDAGASASAELRQEFMRADMTFFSQFRGDFGGRMRRFYSTGGSVPKEVSEFFEVIGIPVLNLYGMIEAGGFPAVSRLDTRRTASCGQIDPAFEVKIAPDGEVMLRGETVARHYWNKSGPTTIAADDDGWLYSGDLGRLDEEGYLYITDRKRHVMVMSTGRKFNPMIIENALTNSPFIAQGAVFGEGKPYISAMIVPNLKALASHFQDAEETIPTTGHPKVKALLDEVIGEVNSRLDRWEYIREYSLLEQPLSQDTGELTPSMKISRHVVAERYAAQITSMYPVTLQLEAKEVSQVQVEPERLRELLEKERILDAWMTDAGIEFLFDLAEEKQIDQPSMVHICDVAAAIAQMENEEKPLSTALIVGNPARIARVLPPSQIQLLHSDHIRRMRQTMVTMAKVVDGLVLGYIVDKHGYVRGISKLNTEELDEPVNFLLGPQFRRHAAISRQCDAVVFFVPAGGRQVRVFADGQMMGRYSNGDWSPESMLQINEVVAQLAEEKRYDLVLVERVLRCAFQMSENNLGAIFIVGNADAILGHSDTSEISHIALIVSAEMEQLSDQELINFAKQDGATVIDVQGEFRGCMVLLRPEANTQADIGAGRGARHSSAAKMSAEANCLAITVSQDGPITVYDSGKRVLSL